RICLGNALRLQRKFDEAIREYREALRMEPENAFARGQLAVALNSLSWTHATGADLHSRDPARAITLVKEALKLDPKLADGWNTLGVAEYRASNWTEAIAALEKYRELRTDDAEWNNSFFLAMANWQMGNKDEARRWYGKAVEW